VLRVKAEDGDKGNPRDIHYVIMVDNNPFAPFFFMEPQTGYQIHCAIMIKRKKDLTNCALQVS
jgi:hypothetical protein